MQHDAQCLDGGRRELVQLIRDPIFHRDGARLHPRAALEILPALVDAVSAIPQGRPGVRLHDLPKLGPLLLPTGPIGSTAAALLGSGCKAVRAILFDKSPSANWALGWHQDRTIAVQERLSVPGFGPWTVKDGKHHVAPPFSILAAMVTLRVHIDPVTQDNAPLLVALGSHRGGVVAEHDIGATVDASKVMVCLADAGDIWCYATPILHASNASTTMGRRRVLQVDYSADALPGGLTWLGV